MIENAEVTLLDFLHQVLTPVIINGREPSSVVGVPVPDHQTITVGVVEDGGDVRDVSAAAGRRGRAVHVEDGEVVVVDLGCDGDDFEVRVDDQRSIQRREGDGVVDDEGHAAPITASRTIAPKDRISRDGRVFGAGFKFRLLYTGHLYIVRVKIF